MDIEHSTADYKLQNMRRFIEQAPAGIIVEIGVWKGGSLRYLAEHCPGRRFFGFDTFTGMPPTCRLDNFHRQGDFADTSYDRVRLTFEDLPHVRLISGRFPDSDVTGNLSIAMAHVDVDIYESTLACFRYLAPRMAPGGRIYCDDAFQSTCEGATLALCQFAVELGRVPQFDLGSHAAFCF
jgi:hypothetical protein